MHIADQVRGDMYAQLAALEEAGVPCPRALQTAAGAHRGLRACAARAAHAVSRGAALARAGERAGLFGHYEAGLIHAATQSGSPAWIYTRLAKLFTRRAARTNALRRRLLLPALILIVAVFIAPLPTLVAGTIDAGEYFARTVLRLVKLMALLFVVVQLPRWLRGTRLRNLWDGLLPGLPGYGPVHVRRHVAAFLELLGVALESGVPADDAVILAANAVTNATLRASFAQTAAPLRHGASLAETFAHNPFLAAAARHSLHSGEVSGKLPERLRHYAVLEQQRIDQFDAALAEWLPRMIYFLVLVWLAIGIIRSGPPLPGL